MNVLGISCWYHDAAACLVRDGKIVAAAQEDRFSRIKHDASFPDHAIAYCLDEAGITTADIDLVAFYDKPFLKFERLLETYVAYAPLGLRSFLKAMPLWLKKKLWIPDLLSKKLHFDGVLLFPEHHESHAASAFYPSPFENAAILTLDGVGEWSTTSYGVGSGSEIRLLGEQHFPHSLGLLYSAFTYFCGFRVNSGEYKLMGLAPYGVPRYERLIRDHLIDIREDGSFRLNMKNFSFASGLTMTDRKFESLLDGERRAPESPLSQREMDIARSIQAVTEDIVLKMARHVRRETGEKNVCLAGGVALNCVANGKLLRENIFDQLWIQPAAGDAGGAVGAALAACYTHGGIDRIAVPADSMEGSYLGPSFSDGDIKRWLVEEDIPHQRLVGADLFERVAALLADGNIVGWFRGRMEFGPRALGNRSILADPRGSDVQRTVNVKVKYRESFRPFAPSVLSERADEFFDLSRESPYMLLVAPVRNAPVGGEGLDRLRSIGGPIPAVTHVDSTARVQTVSEQTNPDFHALITAFESATGCPVVVNTSFNVRGEPIVCSPEDAYRCFRSTHMDAVVIENYLITKEMLPDGDEEILSAEEIASRYGLD